VSGGWGMLAVAALIVANGIFVASEFALVSVQRPVIDDRAASGDRRARLVGRELTDLSYALSAAQFGITLTSLLVGYLAEQTVGQTLVRPVLAQLGIPAEASVAVTVGGALLVSSAVQVVIGELVPKNLAVARPLGIALNLVPATRLFGRVLRPIIRLFDAAAAGIARVLFRIEVATELDPGRTAEEIGQIVAASAREGRLTPTQTRLLERALALGDTRVAAVMVPWPDVDWLPATATLADLREVAAQSGHSRFPVRADTGVVGSVHVKDLLAVDSGRHELTSVTEVATAVLAVPETAVLREVLAQMRRGGRTFALAVDEHGAAAGIVTVEDVLERLVGDIEDEFDPLPRGVRRAGVGRVLLDGSVRVARIPEVAGIDLPDGPFETIAGFVLERLGRVPEPGDRVGLDDVEIVVVRMEGTRVVEVAVERRGDDR
jgi:CBS domain containing-hemolysin-like protein